MAVITKKWIRNRSPSAVGRTEEAGVRRPATFNVPFQGRSHAETSGEINVATGSEGVGAAKGMSVVHVTCNDESRTTPWRRSTPRAAPKVRERPRKAVPAFAESKTLAPDALAMSGRAWNEVWTIRMTTLQVLTTTPK
jgi:hypothetical protein